MIQPRTMLKIADNTGAKILQCFHVLGSTRKRYAQIGDIIVGVVKEALPNLTVKDGEVIMGVVVRTRKPIRRNDGSYVTFDDNAIVIISKELNPRGTRVFGPVARELRDRNFMKIISLAPEVV